MIANANTERRFWEGVDLDNPADLHGHPPYDVAAVAVRLLATSTPPTRILDMGCGMGRLTNHLARRVPTATVYGFDISAPAIVRAVTDAPPNVVYYNGNGRVVPFDIKAPFDLIYSVTMLQHVPHSVKDLYLDQALDLLAPGGTLMFTVAVGNEPKTFLNHQLTDDELAGLALGLAAFGRVTVDGPDDNGWTWIEVQG